MSLLIVSCMMSIFSVLSVRWAFVWFQACANNQYRTFAHRVNISIPTVVFVQKTNNRTARSHIIVLSALDAQTITCFLKVNVLAWQIVPTIH